MKLWIWVIHLTWMDMYIWRVEHHPRANHLAIPVEDWLRYLRDHKALLEPQLNSFGNESLESDVNEGHGDLGNLKGLRHQYQNSPWETLNYTNTLLRIDFICSRGQRRRWERIPSFVTLFEMFWLIVLLMEIVEENNRYTTTLDEEGVIKKAQLEGYYGNKAQGFYYHHALRGYEKNIQFQMLLNGKSFNISLFYH